MTLAQRVVARTFHFGTLPADARTRRRTPVWVSLGIDHGQTPGEPRRFLNVTLFGRYGGRVYERNLYRPHRKQPRL